MTPEMERQGLSNFWRRSRSFIFPLAEAPAATLLRISRALRRRVPSMVNTLAWHGKYAIKESLRNCGRNIRSIVMGKGRAPSDERNEPIDLESITFKVLVSLEGQRERRENAQRQFRKLGIDVEWKIPVPIDDIPWANMPREYAIKPGAASHAITLLAIFDEIERRKAPAFLHFEDDVVFHPRISTLLHRLRVPRDWRFIYLGGRNCGTKTRVSPGLVRSDFISDLHAVIIRSDMIPHIRRLLLDPGIGSGFTDYRIAALHAQYPAYLCRPNLAWQSPHRDDLGMSEAYCNYHADGTVKADQGD